MPVPVKTIRVKADFQDKFNVVDENSSDGKLYFTQGNPVKLEIGLFNGDGYDTSNITKLYVEVKRARNGRAPFASERPRVRKEFDTGELTTIDQNDWDNGLSSLVVDLSSEDSAIREGDNWLVVWGYINGDAVTFASGLLEVKLDGAGVVTNWLPPQVLVPKENLPGLFAKTDASNITVATWRDVLNVDEAGDPRPPTAHASTHATGGADEITPAAIGALGVNAQAADVNPLGPAIAGALNEKADIDAGNLNSSQIATWRDVLGVPDGADFVDLQTEQEVDGIKTFLERLVSNELRARTSDGLALNRSDGGNIVNIAKHGDKSGLAVGPSSEAGGRFSIAIGSAKANGNRSFAFGESGTQANGIESFAGGRASVAEGNAGYAFGFRAKSLHFGSRVEADGQNADVESTADNQYTGRYANGYRFLGGAADFEDATGTRENLGALAENAQAADVNPSGSAISEALAGKAAINDPRIMGQLPEMPFDWEDVQDFTAYRRTSWAPGIGGSYVVTVTELKSSVGLWNFAQSDITIQDDNFNPLYAVPPFTYIVFDVVDTGSYFEVVVASSRSLVQGGDPRLTDSRPPTVHASTHATGGSDELTPADIGAIDDAPSDGTQYARQDGGWAPVGAGGNEFLSHFTPQVITEFDLFVDRLTIGKANGNLIAVNVDPVLTSYDIDIANDWTSTEVGTFRIDLVVNAGQTITFDSNIEGITDLNIPATGIASLLFDKPYGTTTWHVRQVI